MYHPIKLVNKGEIENRILYLAGFGISAHPLKPDWHIQLSLYQHDDCFTICWVEGKGKGNVAETKVGLWKPIMGKYVVPHAIRQIKGTSNLTRMREIMEDIFPDSTWYW
jgi:hypothetical protein